MKTSWSIWQSVQHLKKIQKKLKVVSKGALKSSRSTENTVGKLWAVIVQAYIQ